jgi:hypothetical protein
MISGIPSTSPWSLKTPLCPSISTRNLAAVVLGVPTFRFSISSETTQLIPAVILDSGAAGRAYVNSSFQHDIVALVEMLHALRSVLHGHMDVYGAPAPRVANG